MLLESPTENCGSGHITHCIDSAAFALPASGTFGSAGRNILYGPGLVDADFSIFKNFPIKERLKFQFRAEMFNIFNHPNLANRAPLGTPAPLAISLPQPPTTATFSSEPRLFSRVLLKKQDTPRAGERNPSGFFGLTPFLFPA